MKKHGFLLAIILLLLTGCGSANLSIQLEQTPIYEHGTPSEMTVSITKDGEAVNGLTVTADLEMAKMDHGHLQANLIENGDGTYSGEVELPMGGEWIADVKAESADDKAEELITFDVKER
ncbi:FixH family protein [Sporosarcina sp.]|uniref:FixH family protein n=1 Tax=Sporosarcina sp. TaxID=49982 RepID=UPI002612C6CE|nr:FixH family protein [Sporosarcina sp.]